MRIALFSECYTPVLNGVVIAIQTLRETLRSMGHEVFIFAAGDPQPDDEQVYRLPALPFPKHPYRFARPFPTLPLDFSQLQIDIVHCQHPFPVGRLGARLARKNGIPLVYTVHSLYDTMLLLAKPALVRRLGPPTMRNVMRRFCNQADVVIAPSHYVAQALARCGIAVPIQVVPSGVIPPHVTPGDRESVRCQIGISEEVPVLLYVGRLAPEKRVDLLLEAVALLEQRSLKGPQGAFRLLLVGDGPCRAQLEWQVQRLGIQGRVVFVGAQPHAKIGAWYAAADIFLMPSPMETQGLVVIEAMNCGLPCIAVSEGGAGEAVIPEQTGILCPFSASAFATAIEMLLTNPYRRKQMGQNAYRHAEIYAPARTAQNILAAYAQAQAKHKREPI
ncbi:glycosyltransferase [Chthonomonas calidirosea]|uniref:glycosyltransferase n=1 Tax=Chthonomonas calidirosea TaxID=454171 RepID=UPI0006DD4F23|nr:glycosyltransferase [Chthonomonas calidirosea]CEK16583.1 glycosyltransferase [Chthonomonas calidirosea]CEK16593.1 glycosyltransferase [Chthonomonas calidirosea]